MILFARTFEMAVDSMIEAGEAVEQILLDNPGGKLMEVKQKKVEAKEMEYIKLTVRLQFMSEKLYKKGEIF